MPRTFLTLWPQSKTNRQNLIKKNVYFTYTTYTKRFTRLIHSVLRKNKPTLSLH